MATATAISRQAQSVQFRTSMNKCCLLRERNERGHCRHCNRWMLPQDVLDRAARLRWRRKQMKGA